MNRKLILSGFGLLIVVLTGLANRFYPFFLNKTIYSAPAPTQKIQEPTQPLDLLGYQDYLNSLDRSELQALVSGVRVLERNIPNYSVADADQAFLAFITFYSETLYHCNEAFWQNEKLNSKLRAATRNLSSAKLFEFLNVPSASQKDPEIKTLVQQISSSGLILSVSEGGFYFSENPDFLYNRFSKYLSDSLREFLRLRRQEAAEGFTGDAGLMISFAKVGERIINWEKYSAKYPDSPIKELADYHYQLYLDTFLFGIDNSKVFEDNRLKPEIRTVYENFKQQFASTKTGNLISRYYDVLRANDFKYVKEVKDFFRDNHVPILPGFEP